MASSNDVTLVERTRSAASALGLAASWSGNRRAFDLADDFIYELYILFSLILDLSSYYDVDYKEGTGDNKNRFPQKPANKAGRPRFDIRSRQNGNLLWQVCAGTKITDNQSVERAPDISFQKGSASNTPTHNDVEMIWDAKYRKNPEDRITHSEVAAFILWIDLLNLKNSPKPSLQLNRLREMVANCLITNGRESTEPDGVLNRYDLKEVCSFYPGETPETRPL